MDQDAKLPPLIRTGEQPDRQVLLAWAARYFHPGEDVIIAIGETARDRGKFMFDEFRRLCFWKTPRTQLRVTSNSADVIEEVTAIALSARSERVRIEVLSVLTGVSWPTASAVLHLAHADRYPLLDYRAIEALGMDQPKQYDFDFWWCYVEETRKIAREADLEMRILDRALWQYSKSRGVLSRAKE